MHFKTNQGIKTNTAEQAAKISGENPDHHQADLYNAIEEGDFPSWKLFVQVMEPTVAETYRWNIFDMTKVWPQSEFPLIEVGTLTLNGNPENYFRDIEQAAFSPSTMVPGIAPSADPMLQARMFAYPDAARYRLGVNYQQLPCNRPVSHVYTPYQRDGAYRYDSNYGGDPNYVGSTMKAVKFLPTIETQTHENWAGSLSAFTTQVSEDDFVQPAALWEIYGKTGQQDNFIKNLSGSLKGVEPHVQKETIGKLSYIVEKVC
jgi:catalase